MWDAYWKVRYLSTNTSYLGRFHYYIARSFDKPVTWFRKTVSEPLQDKYKRPYYQRHLSRVPEIDTCPVNDQACIWEANEQFRLDRGIDHQIVSILKYQFERCAIQHGKTTGISKCTKALEEYEDADLNYFIKYGEMALSADVRDAYMKQKHRLVWERRHPEIMAERQRLYEQHKQRYAEGDFDMSFWKTGLETQNMSKSVLPYKDGTADTVQAFQANAFSKDPQFYRDAFKRGDANPDTPPGSALGPSNIMASIFGNRSEKTKLPLKKTDAGE